MLDNLKVGKKLFLLSTSILLLMLAVMFSGYHGITRSVESSEDANEIQETAKLLATLEIDHLNWAEDVIEYLSNDQINSLDVQTDHTLCRFGKWYYGEERKRLEKILPEAKEKLQELEQPHKSLHSSVIQIQKAYRASDPDLGRMLMKSEAIHVDWAYEIQRSIATEENFLDVGVDPQQCELVQFLNGMGGKTLLHFNGELEQLVDELAPVHAQLHEYDTRIEELFAQGDYAAAEALFNERIDPDLERFRSIIRQAIEITQEAQQGKERAKELYYTRTRKHLEQVQSLFHDIRELAEASVKKKIDASEKTAVLAHSITLTGGLAALVVGAVLAVIISRSLSGPLRRTVQMLKDMENGHLDSRLNLNRRDEIGEMAATMDSFADSLQHEVIESLQRLAAGDLTFEITPRDSDDQLRNSLKKLNEDLNQIMEQIRSTGEEIATASGEVADSSQALSQGATESAASLEEISASLNETASQVSQNAENSKEADKLTSEARNAAAKGSEYMQGMVVAMGDIDAAGQDISKIIKTIDEIAFQTNLLALNAAVEAARAGQHGKGFAVVAEEVRSLAARSAKAAAETSDLIQGTVEKTAHGNAMAEQTSAALDEIVAGITKVTDIVAEISRASAEQSTGIAEINQGVAQIDSVTQQNTASSEQSAAAAEELAGQAANLKEMLARFRLKKNPAAGRAHKSQPETEAWNGSSASGVSSAQAQISFD
jgi:methyl-accepting chemotaxis protein